MLRNKDSKIPLLVLTDQYRYEVLGLIDGIDISSFVQLVSNEIHLTEATQRYDFVVNTVHKDLGIIVKQLFYKVG